MDDKEGAQKVQVRVEQPPAQDASRRKGSSSGSSGSSGKDRCRAILQSLHFQGSMQIAAGMFVASLFTFIEPLHYRGSCTAVTFFLAVAVQSSLNSHLGTRINAAASVFGAMWTGALAGGVVATLSKLPGAHTPASTAILCVLGCCVICVMAVNRVAALPPGLWAQGMVNCLTFGMMCISTWKSTTIAEVWAAAAFMLLSSAIACTLSVLTAALVLPTLASDQALHILAGVLRSAGTGTSRYAARLFRPPPDECLPPAAAAAAASLAAAAAASAKGHSHPSSSVDVSAVTSDVTTAKDDSEDDEEEEQRLYSLGLAAPALLMPDEMTDEQWRVLMQRNSEPEARPASKAYQCPMPQLPVMGLRPQLAQVNNFLLPAAAAEPQWLRSGCSCCGSSSSSSGGWFEAAAWAKIVASLQLLISRLSALEAVIEDGESLSLSGQFHPQLLQRLSLVYSQTATSLAFMAQTVTSYGASGGSSSGSGTSGSGSSSDAAAAGPFCEVVDVFGSWREAKDDLAAFMKAEVNYHWSSVMAAEPDSPALLPSLSSVRHLMFTWSLTNGIIDATDQLEKSLAAAVCAAPPPSPLQAACGWLLPLLPAAAAADIFRNWHLTFGQQLPALAKQGRAGLAATAASPLFQAGFKYALALSLILTATILALHFDPPLANFNPAYGYLAAALAMSERVEATFSKVAFWIGGTLVGGALGFLLMFHPALAGNPVGLAAVVAAFAFLVGGFMPSRSKVVITLSLMTLTAIVLCQCCHAAAGEPFYALTRVVSVVSGTVFSVLLCQALLPWYTSQWALEVMAATFQTSIAAVMDMQVAVWHDGAAAVADFEMSCAEQHETFQAILPAHNSSNQQADNGSDELLACAGPLRHDATDTEAAAAAAAALTAAAASAQQQLKLLQPPAPPAAAGTQQASKQQQRAVLATPGGLQLLVAKPLVAVQGSLIRDAVAWQKGVLATPPIVPKLLRVMLGVLDRLAALQLSLSPPVISGRFTGYHMLHYAVPMQQLHADLMPLLVELANTTCRALLQPSCDNSPAVEQAINRLQDHRMQLFRAMRRLRQQLHAHVLQEQQQQVACTAAADNAATAAAAAARPGASADAATAAAEAAAAAVVACGLAESGDAARRRRLAVLLGAVDDVVRFMSFQFAIVKAADRLVAAARLAAGEVCQQHRNTQLSALK